MTTTPSQPAAARATEHAVLCMGAAHWDLIGRPDAALGFGDDRPGRVIRRPGGVALNLALALARLGRRVALAAPLGEDPQGAALAETLAAADVALHRLVTPHPTGLYLAVETGGGALAAAVADLAACEAVTAAALRPLLDPARVPARAWVMEANLPAPALAAIAEAHAALPAPRPLLAANPASPAKAARLAPLLAGMDLLICNRAEAGTLAGRPLSDAPEAARALVDLGVREVAVTDGPSPAAAAWPDGAAQAAPEAPRAAAGATGLGDAFFAAYLDARLAALPAAASLAAGLAAARRAMEAPDDPFPER